MLVKEFEGAVSSTYEDDKVKDGAVASYTLIAVDQSKNESAPAPPITVRVANAFKVAGIKNFRATLQRASNSILIEWSNAGKEVAEYQVYRAKGRQATTLWKVIKGDSTAIEDEEVTAGNIYQYGIRALMKNGSMSEWKELKVEY